jgi:alpha,alpha-trehalase
MRLRPRSFIYCFPSYRARFLLLLAAALFGLTPASLLPAQVQTQSQTQAPAAVPGAQAVLPPPPQTQSIDAYIHQSWDSLSRSISNCQSLVDPKVTTVPVLYLPADVPMPPEITRMQSQCNVRVLRLPQVITRFGQMRPAQIPQTGLLYLPNRYVVPGGRFNEMYGWDSYFIILGLLRDGRVDLARGMVENFFYEIEHYGGILNANRTYFFTRSQPPLLSSMILAVYGAMGKTPQARAFLSRAYGYAQRDHTLWVSDVHRIGDTGLARYFDVGDGPVPEMADDSTYYPDVIRWLISHPEVKTNYIVPAAENPDPTEQISLSTMSCDVRTSSVCAHAWAKGYRLTSDFYKGDRAMRESGFDTSFRFGPFSGSTHHYAPVCLNSLLYRYELDLAAMAHTLSHRNDEAAWKHRADLRKAAIDKFLWNPARGLYFDYDFTTRQQSSYVYASTFYPLWAGAASPTQATAVEHNLNLLERPGGLASSDTASGMQWDLPFGWAPLNYFAVEGMKRAGDTADADQVANAFMKTVSKSFNREGTIHEKYNVLSSSADVQVMAGYKTNVIGFGWTNGVYLVFEQLVAAPSMAHTDTR